MVWYLWVSRSHFFALYLLLEFGSCSFLQGVLSLLLRVSCLIQLT
jgi:hypothetical protein